MLLGVGCVPEDKTTANSEFASISVNPTSFALDLQGGEQTVAVTANGAWTATCLEADVVVTPATGDGDGTAVITVPTATANRNFVVTFTVNKQTLVPGTDMVATTTDSAEVSISQNAGGTDMNDFLYYEKCGTDVEKITVSTGTAWPYIDQFEGWTPEGPAAANVTYSGTSASVRDSGVNYDPTEDAIGLTGAPYMFLNKVPSSAYFVIENLAVTGSTNYTFTFNVSCQNGYNPLTFATVDNSLVHLELGYDGQTWDAVDCTFVPNGGNGWYAATAEFKVAANATTLYARFTYEAPASNGGGRFDDFKLVAGGNGAELNPEAPKEPELPEQPTDPLALPYSETFEQNQGYFTINDVLLGEGLTYVWKHENGQYGYYMKASAYKDGAKASESWLISPEISFVGATAPAVSFEHAHKFAGTPSEELTLWISEDKGTNWTQLTIPAYTSNSDYTFAANTIDLTSYVGKNVKIAFKYVATSSAAGTWEVKNFKVAEGDGTTTNPGEGEEPGQGDNPGTEVTGYNFMSDAAFVDESQNYKGESMINGSATANGSGFKLGTSKLSGYFESKAVGVEGDKVLEFYAVAWKGKSATLYIRKKGTTETLAAVSLNANVGATSNPPFTMTLSSNDYYTVNVPGVTADTVLEFATDASFTQVDNATSGRCVVVGAHLK